MPEATVAPSNTGPSAVPANAPVTPTAPAAPTSAPALPAPAAPAAPKVSPIKQALANLSPTAGWGDASGILKGAAQPEAPAAPPADTGQPRNELGQFASPNAEADAAPQEGAAPVSGEDGDLAAPEGDEAQPDAEGAEDAPEPITVTLKGRNGEEVPFVVENEADADVLRALQNDAMRGAEFKRKSADLETGFAQLRDVAAQMQADPEGFMIGQLTPERQLSVARALLLNNWDTLAPEVEQFWNNPIVRGQALLDVRQNALTRTADVNNLVAGYRAAAEAERTILGLIPESASETDADAFFSDATAYLTGLAQQGRKTAANDIPQALGRITAAYGFGATAPAPAVPAAPAPNGAAPSAPASDPLAERKAKAAATVRRLTNTAKQRTAAARVAPQGAGAAGVEAPKPPKGADITQTTQFLKGRISKGTSWSDLFRRG